ncbi:hypothetical protein [Idiomarina sp.]|uniref:hypothetical protein n=1 Tax=Idiomarina sp. TaxID=1874361 RepID=UPI0025BB8170|nr:hypothetical protein [Idiomarina sp.]|tara:strand:- start:349 stop:507 length:159 start_codon:yes stop_codon:yes gene_type:complete
MEISIEKAEANLKAAKADYRAELETGSKRSAGDVILSLLLLERLQLINHCIQ